MAKDRELQDHERAHTGKPGSKVDHGGVYSYDEPPPPKKAPSTAKDKWDNHYVYSRDRQGKQYNIELMTGDRTEAENAARGIRRKGMSSKIHKFEEWE